MLFDKKKRTKKALADRLIQIHGDFMMDTIGALKKFSEGKKRWGLLPGNNGTLVKCPPEDIRSMVFGFQFYWAIMVFQSKNYLPVNEASTYLSEVMGIIDQERSSVIWDYVTQLIELAKTTDDIGGEFREIILEKIAGVEYMTLSDLALKWGITVAMNSGLQELIGRTVAAIALAFNDVVYAKEAYEVMTSKGNSESGPRPG